MDFNDFNHEELLKIFKGEAFYLKRKYRKKKLCKICSPIILISNDEPNYRFINLLHIVKTEESIFLKFNSAFFIN